MRVPILSNDGQATVVAAPTTTDNKQHQVATLQVEPIPDKNAMLVRVQTPKAPARDMSHVPCDIVLVIDISGSMGASAPVPGEDASEHTGLTVLDLTKHAARTIIETMNDHDRLGIVTFGSKAKVVQKLLPMTEANKELARDNIKALVPRDATNLWHGLLEGIKLFNGCDTNGKAASIMVLTDGLPNHMQVVPTTPLCTKNPPQGYVPKIRSMGPLPATIHTFGFGYKLKSGLLKSIAEIGRGNYAFIPDAGMIGTVFVHAVANIQATFATNCTLNLTYRLPLVVETTTGQTVDQDAPKHVVESSLSGLMRLTVNLGNLQFGQPRDVYLSVKNIAQAQQSLADPPMIKATLTYTAIDTEPKTTIYPFSSFLPKTMTVLHPSKTSVMRSIVDTNSLSPSEIAYQESRALICGFLASLTPIGGQEEHTPLDPTCLTETVDNLTSMIQSCPAAQFKDAHNQSLMEDLVGDSPKGQISLAIGNEDYYRKWGMHYLPSLLNAHQRQICNSFKDSGPQMYGVDSPLFIACRDRLDNAFDNLPAPEPSSFRHQVCRSRGVPTLGPSMTPVFSMARYRNASGVCFAACTKVHLASGRTVKIRKLRRGMKVRTPAGTRKVAMVLKTPVEREVLCRKGDVLVTPWHPISSDGGKTWCFPAQVADNAVLYTGAVYSVLLQRDGNSSAHAIRVGSSSLWGVTLGHGLRTGTDVRAHAFFGDYNIVGKSLLKLERRNGGVVVGGGVVRDEETGLVKGFKRAQQKKTSR